MDPRERADAALARARARGAFVVTPESAVSPMDAASTLQIPRVVVDANDQRRDDDPDATMVVPGSVAQGRPDLPQQASRAEENVPAIAQEALTDVVGAPPGIRSRQRRLEDAERARQQRKPRPSPAPSPAPSPSPAPAKSAPPTPSPTPSPAPSPEQQQPAPPAQQQTEELDGLIPTTKPAPHPRSTLSQRLDG